MEEITMTEKRPVSPRSFTAGPGELRLGSGGISGPSSGIETDAIAKHQLPDLLGASDGAAHPTRFGVHLPGVHLPGVHLSGVHLARESRGFSRAGEVKVLLEHQPPTPSRAQAGIGAASTPVPAAALDLVMSARRSLTEAILASTPSARYAAAHLAALRAAAAVLAARSRPTGRRRRVRSVWIVLPEVAAEFTEFAMFFAAGARKRAAAAAGIPCVSEREADDLVRDADTFLARIVRSLGLPHQPMLMTQMLSS